MSPLPRTIPLLRQLLLKQFPLCFHVNETLAKDHPSFKTTFAGFLGWSCKRGFTMCQTNKQYREKKTTTATKNKKRRNYENWRKNVSFFSLCLKGILWALLEIKGSWLLMQRLRERTLWLCAMRDGSHLYSCKIHVQSQWAKEVVMFVLFFLRFVIAVYSLAFVDKVVWWNWIIWRLLVWS